MVPETKAIDSEPVPIPRPERTTRTPEFPGRTGRFEHQAQRLWPPDFPRGGRNCVEPEGGAESIRDPFEAKVQRDFVASAQDRRRDHFTVWLRWLGLHPQPRHRALVSELVISGTWGRVDWTPLIPDCRRT